MSTKLPLYLTVFIPLFVLNHQAFAQSVNFQDPVIVDAPGNTRDLAIDHLNGDAILDMITVGNTTDDITVHRGAGNLSYNAFTYGAADSPQRLATGDFNEDGYADVAVSSSIDDLVTVRLNNQSAGFNSSASYAAGNTPIGITANDFNNDNHVDLAVAIDLGDQKAVYLGNGDGTFQSALISFGGDRPQDIVSADLNGDNFMDLIVSNRNDDEIGVFLGNGDGSFGTITSYTGGGDVPEFMELADLNGDAEVDVILSNSFGNSITVLTGNGDGSFNLPVSYTVPAAPKGLTIFDINLDGNLDVAVACEDADSFSVLLGNGDATLNAPLTFPTGNGAYNMQHRDMDGDGIEDLLVVCRLSGGKVYIYLNDICPQLSIEGTNTSSLNGTDGEATLSISGGTPPYEILWDDPLGQSSETISGLSAGSYSVTVSDLNCEVSATVDISDPICAFSLTTEIDQLPDPGASNGSLSAVLLDGTGPFTIDWGGLSPNDQLSVGNLELGYYSVIVTDGIGCQAQSAIYLPEATQFCDTTFINARLEELYFEDLNGDQENELIGLNPWSDNAVVFEAEGDGNFANPAIYPIGAYTQNAVVVDIDGDQIPDLVATAPDSPDIGIVLSSGNGDGTFQAGVDVFVGSRPWDIEYDDLDEDGDFDIILTRDQGDDIRIITNNNGVLTTGVALSTGNAPIHMVKGDFNEDGRMDFMVSNSSSWHLSLILGNGSLVPSVGDELIMTYQPYDLVAADVNGDSHLDVVVVHDGNDRLSVHLGNGDGSFEGEMLFDCPVQPLAITASDFNGDGFIDIATANLNSSTLAIFPGSGNGEFGIYQSLSFDRPLEVVATDLNGDGDIDLALALNNAVLPYQLVLLENCRINGCTGDLNNDGQINSGDLVTLLGDFSCNGECIADINGDGQVNTGDLTTLLGVLGESCF